MLKDYDDLT